MAKRLGPIDIVCDAPSYNVVRACMGLGFRNPEDVRWCRVSQFLLDRSARRGGFQLLSWMVFPGPGHLDGTCSCGEGLPRLEKCVFLLRSGKELTYLLGQCPRCATMFWDNA